MYPFKINCTNITQPTYTLSKGTDTSSYYAMVDTEVTITIPSYSASSKIYYWNGTTPWGVANPTGTTKLSSNSITFTVSSKSMELNTIYLYSDKMSQTLSVNSSQKKTYNQADFNLGATVT